MKKNKLLTALALASAAFAVSAQNIATVNGKPIPKSLQDEWVAQLVANGGKDTPEARRQITENLVANALVEQEAAKRKISDDPKVKFALDYAKFRILQEALLRDEMAKHPVSEKEIKARYEEEKAALGNKEYEVSHILVKDQKTAENIEKKLAAGGNFAALAKEFSVDTGAKENGGDLGWNRPAVFVKPFADAVKNMKKGENYHHVPHNTDLETLSLELLALHLPQDTPISSLLLVSQKSNLTLTIKNHHCPESPAYYIKYTYYLFQHNED